MPRAFDGIGRMEMRQCATRRLLHVLPSFGIGGIQTRFARIANRLGRKYQHIVIALDGVLACRNQLDPAVDVHFHDIHVDKSRPVASLLRYRRTLAGLRPDLLLTYNWGALEWGLVNRIFPIAPHLHFEDGFGSDEASRQFRRRVLARRLILARAIRVVVPSRTLERIALEVWRLDPRHVAYVPNGVDLRRFAAPGDPALLAPPKAPGQLVIGTVAPLRAEKNIGRLIRAFAELPVPPLLRLVIAGDGRERPALEALARSLGIADRVSFAGHVSNPERILPFFDIFALSSDTEQMPLTVLEAMAAGLPIAAVDVGDVKAMVHPDNRGFIVPKDSPRALADSLIALVRDGRLRIALGEANRRRAEAHFPEDKMFATYDALYSLSHPVRSG